MIRPGFTLIEMVVALLLASIMMVGLLGIVSTVTRETIQLRSEQTDYAAVGFMSDRIREDLINARGMLVDGSSITLSGFVGVNRLPGLVRYEAIDLGGTRVLARRAQDQTEWMWVGFGRFIFTPLAEIDGESVRPAAAGDLSPIPVRFSIGITDQTDRMLYQEVIHHHEES